MAKKFALIGQAANPLTQAEREAGLTPDSLNLNEPSPDTGQTTPERYRATGDGSTDDYTAIQRALDIMHDTGGGTVRIRPGSRYKTGTSLVIPENVVLESTGYHGQPNELAAIIAPTSAVSVGIDDAGSNRRGLGIRGVVVDMVDMPDGATGVRFSGVHQFFIDKLGVFNLPDATAIGLHLRGDAASGFGTLYGRVSDLNISTNNDDIGVGVVCETVGAERANAILFENARVAHLTTGWKFIGTGSGILCLNCNSESSSGNGVEVTSTISGTMVRWYGGEVNSNGGWGFTGSGGRVVTDATMGSNSSGDVDTATLTVGARILVASAGPSYEVDGAHIRTDKGFIGGGTNQTVIAADTIVPASLKVRLTAAGAISMSSNPQITDGTSNQLLVLVGTSDTNTITIIDGQGLRLSANMVLGLGDTLTLIYDSGGTNDWVELARSNN